MRPEPASAAPPRSTWRAVWRAAAWLAALGVAAIAACWQLRPDHPALDVLTHLAEPARPLAFLAAGAMLALRLRGPALSILLAASALTIGMATEHRPAHADDRAELTVYSANLWWENENVDATAASIAAANADVVVLIELGDAQSEALDRLLAGYPNRVTTPRVGWRRGASRNVIASRLPLEKIEDTGDGLAVVSARLRLPDGTNLRVLGAHLTRPWPLRAHYAQPWQAVRLAERVGASAEPTLLVGDFNAAPHGRAVTRVEARTPLRAAAGEGGTWPRLAPPWLRVTLDEVLASPQVRVRSRRLGQPNGSDHLPVIVDLDLTPAAPP